MSFRKAIIDLSSEESGQLEAIRHCAKPSFIEKGITINSLNLGYFDIGMITEHK